MLVKPDEMYREYADGIYKYLMTMCQNHHLAEELTQDTFLKAIKGADSFDGNVKVFTWLCAIAKNSYLSYLRKEKHIDSTDISSSEIPVNGDMLDNMNCTEIYRAVHKLEEPYREIILLRIHTDLSFASIGDIFGKSENWARVAFYRGKVKLKNLLEDSL